MKIDVRILAATPGGAVCRIVRLRDRRPLFGGRSFDDEGAARRWLAEANARHGSPVWREVRPPRPKPQQLRLFA
jgi:hypothetical protein